MSKSKVKPRVSDSAKAERTRRRREIEPRQIASIEYGPFGKEIKVTNYSSVAVAQDAGRARAPSYRTADAQARPHFPKMRAESQRMDEENLLFASMNTRLCDFAIGDGSTVQVQTADKDWNAAAEKWWNDWWGGAPESRGLDTGPEIERKVFRHVNVDGDILVTQNEGDQPESDVIQLIVADQIGGQRAGSQMRDDSGNVIEQGVILDENRKPLGFLVYPYTDTGTLSTEPVPWMDLDRCVYLAYRRRIDQTRGEPLFQSSFGMHHRIDDVLNSEAASWQLSSRLAFAIKSKESASAAYANSETDDAVTPGTKIADRVQDVATALIAHLEPGEDIATITHENPGQNFPEAVKMYLRLLGLSAGFSLEFMLLIWSEVNYSSGRASVKQVERNLRPQRIMMQTLLSALYRWRIRRGIETKRLRPPKGIDPFTHKIVWMPYPFIDQQKERQAQREAIESGLESPQTIATENGGDWDEIIKSRLAAYERIVELVRAHNDKYQGRPELHLNVSDFIPRGGVTPSVFTNPFLATAKA